MIIKTSNPNSIQPFIKHLRLPNPTSHKGQNGRLLIIGGSSLFHAASLWSAAIASHLVDMVHYSSTEENQQVFLALKTKFVDGMIIKKQDLLAYAEEDNCILIGPGMIRGKIDADLRFKNLEFSEILSIKDEPSYTYCLTKFLIDHSPAKQFIFDAGALQMMEKDWLITLRKKAILTPHQGEFETLFNKNVKDLSSSQKRKIVQEIAKKYHCVILLKAVSDIVSDGTTVMEIHGGNAGLTKGGTGDVLAGLIAGLSTITDALTAGVLSSFLLKKAAEELFEQTGYWYNTTDLISQLPKTMKKLTV